MKLPILYVSDGLKWLGIKAIKGEKGDKGDKGDRGDGPSEEQMHAVASREVAKIIAEAPEDFDTLKEISDWIATHADDASAMNTAILQNTADIAVNASDIAVNTADIADLKSKGVGEEITYEDFQNLTEEQIANGDYYITDYPDEFANAENIPYEDTNVGEALDSIRESMSILPIPKKVDIAWTSGAITGFAIKTGNHVHIHMHSSGSVAVTNTNAIGTLPIEIRPRTTIPWQVAGTALVAAPSTTSDKLFRISAGVYGTNNETISLANDYGANMIAPHIEFDYFI